jgi:hypothetical protein
MEKSGLKLAQVYFERTYNLQPGDVEVTTPQPPLGPLGPPKLGGGAEGGGGKFAESPSLDKGRAGEGFPDQIALDKFIAGLTTPAELQELIAGVLKPVFKAVEEGGDLQELYDELPRLFPEMDTSRIEEILGRAFFVASVWGRLSAENEG